MLKLGIISPTFAALCAALLFGASTPFAKQLVGEISPLPLAGLLYLGSGVGLFFIRLIRDRGWRHSGLVNKDWPWLIGAIVLGGIVAPTMLMFGLQKTSASSASLLLNLESVLTALLAWVIFKEHTAYRIVIGMILIVAGGILLSWPNAAAGQNLLGPLVIAGACLCWAIDNNLTRKISACDALFLAGSKGLISGIVSISLALSFGLSIPGGLPLVYALSVGFVAYGASLVLFVVALRGLGTARTGAYFSTAPFIGAAVAIIFFHEPTSILFWIASVLMAIGVWLHLSEKHEHEHEHDEFAHNHFHSHDEHHQHEHEFPHEEKDTHAHGHTHKPIKHSHHHFPDIHHRHDHKGEDDK